MSYCLCLLKYLKCFNNKVSPKTLNQNPPSTPRYSKPGNRPPRIDTKPRVSTISVVVRDEYGDPTGKRRVTQPSHVVGFKDARACARRGSRHCTQSVWNTHDANSNPRANGFWER